MITYEWADSWSGHPEVAGLLEAAAGFDAEQGFSATPPRLDPGAAGRVRELVAWMTPEVGSVTRGRPRAAAFLRVRTGPDGDGVLELVVHPDFRSLGVATLLAEELGSGVGADGWAGTGATALRCWARGSHPAAERMARRFHADVERTLWRILLRTGKTRPPLRDNDIRVEQVRPGVLAAKDGSGGYVHLHPPGTISVLEADDDVVRAALLSQAVDRLRGAGAREVEMLVDASDDGILRTCRRLGFHHDQTDLCFRVPLRNLMA